MIVFYPIGLLALFGLLALLAVLGGISGLLEWLLAHVWIFIIALAIKYVLSLLPLFQKNISHKLPYSIVALISNILLGCSMWYGLMDMWAIKSSGHDIFIIIYAIVMLFSWAFPALCSMMSGILDDDSFVGGIVTEAVCIITYILIILATFRTVWLDKIILLGISQIISGITNSILSEEM